jgi:hypothetical protein
MSKAEDSRLAWYRRASENLRRYLQELETARDALRNAAGDTHATDQLIPEVKRRLEELEKLLADSEPD